MRASDAKSFNGKPKAKVRAVMSLALLLSPSAGR